MEGKPPTRQILSGILIKNESTDSQIEEDRAMSTKVGTSDAVAILRRRYVSEDPARRASLEEERINAKMARQIYDLRLRAGMTQKELAERVQTTQSVISRLEDADYEGHSLSMLRRIADVLGARLDVELTAT